MNDSFLVVKGVCNTNCTFCNFYETKGKIDEEEHLIELKKEVELLAKKQLDELKVGFNGYEPTSFKYLFEILKFIKSKNIKVSLFTNGVKLADSEYTKKLSGLVDKVVITIYSSDDKEHNILTQNKDSYILKHSAIANCLKNKIKVETTILMLTPTIVNLSKIVLQLSKYFTNKFYSKKLVLIVPNSTMGAERNRLLVPPYTSIINAINLIIQNHYDLLLKNNITLELNSVIPKCIFNISKNNKVLTYLNRGSNTIIKKTDYDKKKFITSYSPEKIFFKKCNNCQFLEQCEGVEKTYVDIYGSSEFENGEKIESNLSLDEIKISFDELLLKYREDGIWFNFEYLDSGVKNYEKLFILPKMMLNYYIKDVLILNNSIKKIRLSKYMTKDSFIVEVNMDDLGNYTFKTIENINTNNKIQNLILLFFHKAFNKNKTNK